MRAHASWSGEPQRDQRRGRYSRKADAGAFEEAADHHGRDIVAAENLDEPSDDHADGRKRDRLLQPQLAADEGGGEGKYDADKRYHRHQHAEAACIEAETAVGTDPRHIDEIKRNRDDLELRHGRSKAYQERDDPNHPRVAGVFSSLIVIFDSARGRGPRLPSTDLSFSSIVVPFSYAKCMWIQVVTRMKRGELPESSKL